VFGGCRLIVPAMMSQATFFIKMAAPDSGGKVFEWLFNVES